MSGEEYTFTFKDAGGSAVPVEHRLRHMLKHALRACRLRCVSASQTHAEEGRDASELSEGEGKCERSGCG